MNFDEVVLVFKIEVGFDFWYGWYVLDSFMLGVSLLLLLIVEGKLLYFEKIFGVLIVVKEFFINDESYLRLVRLFDCINMSYVFWVLI